jgi:hypothetical protein
LNIDLGSPIIDIAIGVSFVFFLLSLIASAVSEFFAGVFNLRGKILLKGIKGMVGNAELAEKVFSHPLVRTNMMKKPKGGAAAAPAPKPGAQKPAPLSRLLTWLRNLERKPAYVSASNFSHALLAIAKDNPKRTTLSEPGQPSSDQLWEQLEALGVRGLRHEAESDLGKVEKWFDDSMDRVSGWYKRRSQYLTIVVAIAVACALNANAIRIIERLDQEPSTRAAVVSAAEHAVAGGTTKEETKAEEEKKTKAEEEGKETPPAVSEIQHAGEHFASATKELTALNLPLFWSKANSLHSIAWWKTGLGLLFTVIAISLGAPFWFDALGKLSNLRMAGKKPEEDKEAPA